MRYTVRPISDHTWLRPANQREASRFDSTWTKTQSLLGREIDTLGGRDVVVEVDVPERAIRLDGMLRADARATSPAVAVAFESKHGPMLYRCDRFTSKWHEQGPDWQQNVRAIALTLESLRAVDRYGATETGQQYAGFKAIGGGAPIAPGPATMTRRAAAELIERVAIGDEGTQRERSIEVLMTNADRLREAVKYARAGAHPDRRGGDHALAYEVDQAARVLGVTR